MMHHQFFTDKDVRFANSRDWRVTFFPPYALVTFILMSIPGALVVGWLISANAGWLLMATTTGMYMLYEFMHYCCHVNENWFVRLCPFVNTIRRHHSAHHNQSIMMERNMNLTFPIADWLFGTSDLDRGLIGHIFNGYDTSACPHRYAAGATVARACPASDRGKQRLGASHVAVDRRYRCRGRTGDLSPQAPRPQRQVQQTLTIAEISTPWPSTKTDSATQAMAVFVFLVIGFKYRSFIIRFLKISVPA